MREYFQCDPTGDYLDRQLKGLHLSEGNYVPVQPTVLPDNSLSLTSEMLGLELRVQAGKLQFHDPATGAKLLTHQESEQARQQAEEGRRQAEQARADAIPRLLAMGLSVEQVAEALGLPADEVRQTTQK